MATTKNSNKNAVQKILEGTSDTYVYASSVVELYEKKFGPLNSTNKTTVKFFSSTKGTLISSVVTFIFEDNKYRAISSIAGGTIIGGITAPTVTAALIAFCAGLGVTVTSPVVIAIGFTSGVAMGITGASTGNSLYDFWHVIKDTWSDFWLDNEDNSGARINNKTTIHTKTGLQSFLEENKEFTQTLKDDNIKDWTINASMTDINDKTSLQEILFYNNKKPDVKLEMINKSDAQKTLPRIIDLNAELKKYDINVKTTDDSQEYTVMKDETIDKIAKENGISRDVLLNYKDNTWVKDENRISKNIFLIKRNERLKIPAKDTNTTSSVSSSTKSGKSIFDFKDFIGDSPHQNIKARLIIKDFMPNLSVLNGSYSVYKFKGKSAVNEPYSFDITFVSNLEIDISDLSEKDVELEISDANSMNVKMICGKILEATQRSVVANKYMYKIKIVSPLKYLHYSKRYRIFHNKTASDIIKQIIKEYNTSLNMQIEVSLDSSQNVARQYTTQYGESDLSFIQRLCEEEGYAFVCDYSNSEVYKIILCDLNEQAKEINGITTGNYNFSKRFTTPQSIFKYYDEQRPSLELKKEFGKNINSSVIDNSLTSQFKADIKHYEQKDMINYHKGTIYNDLSRYTKLNSERNYVKASIFKGSSSELAMQDSIFVTLKDAAANKSAKIIILGVKYEGHFANALDEHAQDDNIDKVQYSVNFTAIPADIVFRPQLKTAKPKVKGMLTAIVSKGKAGSKEDANDIDVDNEGRIRVLLHFEEDQLTSCYIRLSSFYCGNGYGALFLPRVNSEVIVHFENGDPDKPIITGAIHNGENKNPYPLPQTKTKSHIRTNSMPQHEDQIGFNELSFEDKKDNEVLSLRAQKDYKLMAQNDSRIDIDNDQIENIINDQTLNVNHDHKITIVNDQSIEVQNDQTNHIFENQNNTIDKNKIIQISNEQKEDIYGKYDLKVGDKSTTEVGENYNLKAKNKIIKLTDLAELKAKKIILKAPGGTIILGSTILFKGPVTIKGSLSVSGGSGGGSPLSVETLTPFVSNASNKEGTEEEVIELEVEEIVTYKRDKDSVNCVAILNLVNVSEDDKSKIRWIVEDELVSEYNGQEDIHYNLKDKGLEKVHFKAYIDAIQSEHALADVAYIDTKPKKRKAKTVNT